MSRTDNLGIALRVFAAINLLNGIWMLASPNGWFYGIPAAVPDTGPLNEHFVRDVGGTYVTMALALLWAAERRALRVPLVTIVLVFHVLHAGAHMVDTLAGRLPMSHWAVDFPGVYLPTIGLVLILVVAARQSRRADVLGHDRS